LTSKLQHRGPDDEGYIATDTQQDILTVRNLSGPCSKVSGECSLGEFDGKANLYLGHRRLSILDLSAAGHQPMKYGHHLWIVFNGEIYNYIELRAELRGKGYEFHTGTDTEVAVAAYQRWGEECVTRFNGDWAFCILDAEKNTLFLSRDRYGIKPLYFFKDPDYFAFASEIKALLSLPFVRCNLNGSRASDFLALFCHDHTEETLYDGIYQIKPGHSMRLDIHNGKSEQFCYYTPRCTPGLGHYNHRRALSYASDIRDLLFDAVKLRLRADVSVGTCLSGGLDSSTVVAIASKLLGTNGDSLLQNTFTASFPGKKIDETPFARLVVDHARTRSHFIYPSLEQFRRNFHTILYYQDEPFSGSSIYTQWEVMREASKHVKVLLDGQGGDEVFAGYVNYRVSFLANLLIEGRFDYLVKELWYLLKRAASVRTAASELKLLPFTLLPNSWKWEVYRLRYRKQIKLAQTLFSLDHCRAVENIRKLSAADANQLLTFMLSYRLPRLLKYADRNSMAHSIESRVPFTDYRLVDYLYSIPTIYKIRDGWTKWLLRLAVNDLLPEEIVWRRDKLGFATPEYVSRQTIWEMWFEQHFADNKALRSIAA
jgi:asparagine synthase (glutamine-hydrolysing)